MNKIKIWKIWFKRQPWSYRWFLWIVLLRPFIDIFWDVKKEFYFSPLQLIGVLIVTLSSYYAVHLKTTFKYYIPKFYILFCILFFINQLILLYEFLSYQTVGSFLKNILPLILFFYLIKIINNKKQIEGFFITYLISSIFPLLMLYYETFFHPIKYVYLSESRGGGIRLTGFYADMFNYMAYVIGDFIIFAYFYLKTLNNEKSFFKVSHIKFLIIFISTIIALYGLKHQASWIVFVVLNIILIRFIIKVRKKNKFFLILLAGFFLCLGFWAFFKVLPYLFYKDILVLQGSLEESRALNGRIYRWEIYFDYWNNIFLYSKLLGVGFSDLNLIIKRNMMSGGMHSDYIRFLFSAGIIGLLCYLMTLYSIWKRTKYLKFEEKFMVHASLLIFLLYSVSANPFMASGALMYLVLVNFSIAIKQIYFRNGKNEK